MAKTTIPRTCEQCGTAFQALPKNIRVGKARFCSPECYTLSIQRRVDCVCRTCGKAFTVTPSKVAIGEGKYCSRDCHNKHRNATDDAERIARFWANVDIVGECWIWKGSKCHGYGVTRMHTEQGVILRAHQAAYILSHGPVPDGKFVCHDCPDGDNPACINPAHLWAGTPAENSADMVRKGRSKGTRLYPEHGTRGEENGHARLTEKDVREIRRLPREGFTYRQIASRFGVSRSAVAKIVQHILWAHITD